MVVKILKEHKIAKDDYRLGKSKVFIRKPATVRGGCIRLPVQLFYFEEKREAAIPGVVVRMQSLWRGYKVRTNWQRRKASSKIVNFYRSYKVGELHST